MSNQKQDDAFRPIARAFLEAQGFKGEELERYVEAYPNQPQAAPAKPADPHKLIEELKKLDANEDIKGLIRNLNRLFPDR